MYFKFNKLIAWIWFPPNRPPTRHNKKTRKIIVERQGENLQVFWVTSWWCSICCWKVVVCTLKGPEFNSKFETSFEQYPQHGRRSVSGWPFALFRGFWALWRNAKDASESKHHSFECLIECLWDTWAHYLQLAVFVCFQQFTILGFLEGRRSVLFFLLLLK